MAAVAIEDLSGTSASSLGNPYDSLIEAASDDAVRPATLDGNKLPAII